MKKNLQLALEQLKKGNFILIYDGDDREGEADLVFHARFATPEKIERMRKDAGGLICVALAKEIAEVLKLEFLVDMLKTNERVSRMIYKKTAYGDKPAFSLAVNHKDVYTGIPDNDRALTIKKIWETTEEKDMRKYFVENFYTPGHIFLLIGRGLENRKGHTELSLKLAELAGIEGTMVLCEMLGKGKALSKEKAKYYAEKNGFMFIEGKEIVKLVEGRTVGRR